MKRKQIYLGEESEQRLKALAMRLGTSEASLVREAVERYLDAQQGRFPKGDENPLAELIGIADEGPSDGALRHDSYLYGEGG